MKKYIKLFLLLIAIFIFTPIIKNTILYFTYHHKPTILLKVNEYWMGVFDSHWEGIDSRQFLCIKQLNDSLGLRYSKTYGEKIDGKYSNTFSWHALLPFSKPLIYSDTVILVSKHHRNMNIKWEHALLYKISNDSMYVSEYYPAGYFNKNKVTKIDIYLQKKYYKNFFKSNFRLEAEQPEFSKNYNYYDVVNLKRIPYEWEELYREIYKYFKN